MLRSLLIDGERDVFQGDALLSCGLRYQKGKIAKPFVSRPRSHVQARVPRRMKELLPNANVLAVLQMRPELLVMPGAEAAMERALRTMLKLMPGIPVAEQLERGGSQWRTFVDLIGAELPASARMRSVKQKAALKEAVGRRRRGPPPIE